MRPNRLSSHAALLGLVTVLAACVPVTVNINFPQEHLDEAAGSIEDMVRDPQTTPAAPSQKPPAPGSHLADRLFVALGPRLAEAQGRTVDVVPEIRTQTPELMRAIDSRRARNPQIEHWKARGCIGENNQALLEARPGQGCGGEVGGLIAAENADRSFIYDTLMQQNNIPASDAPRVRAAFAKADRDRARPGEWIQDPSGQWVKR